MKQCDELRPELEQQFDNDDIDNALSQFTQNMSLNKNLKVMQLSKYLAIGAHERHFHALLDRHVLD